jgi:hypothetical protein
MASYNGILLDNNILGLLTDSALDTIDVAEYPTDKCFLGEYLETGGVKTDIFPTPSVDTFDGLLMGDFADLWYNRVHIIPNRIDVGNLVSQQVRPIEIWNGYFIPVTLEDVVATDLLGVTFDVTTPLVIAALESTYKNLVINTVGSPQFDGFFTLTFDDVIIEYFLYVSGKRVLVMPFQHNWSERINERLAWYNTSSGKSLDGIEQLVMLRNAPRRSLSYQFLLASTNSNAARLRALFAALIAGWQTRIFAIPIWSDATRLAVTAASGQNEVQVNTTYFDYDADNYVMLWQNEENYELVEIDEVFSTYLTLKVNLVKEWQAGKTVVMPARLAYVNPNLQGQKHTVDIDTVPVSFELLPQYLSINRLVYAAETTYRSLPVLLTKSNYDNTQSFTLEQQVIRNDANVGIFNIEADQPAPDASNTFGLIFNGHSQIAKYYGWLDNRKGRLAPFWQPTWSKDMQVVQDIASATTNILINAIGYASLYYIDDAPAYNRRDIMIQLKNGTRYFRRITGAGINEDGTETIGIDTALGADILISQIDRVCFLIPSALKADAVEIQWHSGNVAASDLLITDVYDDTI